MSPVQSKQQLLAKIKNQFSGQASYSGVSQDKSQAGSNDFSTQQLADPQFSTQEKLDVLDGVLTEIENQPPQQPAADDPIAQKLFKQAQQLNNQATQAVSPSVLPVQQNQSPGLGMVGQALPQAATQQFQQPQQQLNQLNPPPQYVAPAQKERVDSGQSPVETGAGLQYVEQEKQPEIPPEVEKFVNKIDQEKIESPKEIVVADQQQDMQNQHYAAEPVVVLPITPELEKKNKNKSPKYSVRWLIEWSQKIVKMFAGKVIYRHAE